MAIIALALTAVFAFGACAIAPTTSHSGRTENGTVVVLDFDATFGTQASHRAVVAAVEEIWDNAALTDAQRATRYAALSFWPNGAFEVTTNTFGSRERPSQVRTMLDVNMFGEINWPTETGVDLTRASGQGFYTINTAWNEAREPDIALDIAAGWFGLGVATVEAIEAAGSVWTAQSLLMNALTARWDGVYGADEAASPLEGSALVARRQSILNAINNNLVTAEMRDLGYSYVVDFDETLADASNGPNLWVQMERDENNKWLVGHEFFEVTRYLRYTLTTAPRIYWAYATVRGDNIEMTGYVSWNADRDNFTDFVAITADCDPLLPMVPVASRFGIIDAGMDQTTASSVYIGGQLRTIFHVSGEEIDFIISRP